MEKSNKETSSDFTKICLVGRGRDGNIFVKITHKNKKLSISGVEEPLSNGNCQGGCGQIEMRMNEEHINNIVFVEGWNKNKIKTFLDIWRKWHLNGMFAGCVHQREAKWKEYRIDPRELPKSYANRDDRGIIATSVLPEEHKDGKLNKPCPICGYKYGSKWLFEKVPELVLSYLQNLPESNIKPNWI